MSAGTSSKHYVKIWAILLALLVISVVGPMAEIRTLTLITAFGIAVVKAFLVAKHFMHLNLEKHFVSYFLGAMLLISVLFYYGTAADVMKPSGQNWYKNIGVEEASHPEMGH